MSTPSPIPPPQTNGVREYKLYKQRFVGLFGVVCLPPSGVPPSDLSVDDGLIFG